MNWFKNLKIKTKLFIGFGLVACITLTVGYVGYSKISTVVKNQDTMYLDRLIPIQDLGYINAALLTARGDLVAALGTDDLNKRREYINSIRNESKKIDELIDKYSKTLLTKDEEEILPKFIAEWNEYKLLREGAIDYLLNMRDNEAKKIIYGESLSHQLEARKNLVYLIENNAKVADQLNKSATETGQSASTLLIIFSVSSAIAALVLGIFISSVISNPVNKLLEATNKFASGDLNVKIENDFKDEIGELINAFQNMMDKAAIQIQYLENVPNPVMVIDNEFSI